MSTKVGPRCGVRAARHAASTSATIDAADVAVAAVFVTGATIGTWSSSCSEPDAPAASAARGPPSTTIGEPFIRAAVSALTPFVTPGPGGERRAAEPARHLGPAFGRERRGLLVAHVDEPQLALCTRRRRARTDARPTA